MARRQQRMRVMHEHISLQYKEGQTSSSRRMRGFLSRARAMAMRCFCPPDICTPFSPMCVSYLHAQQGMSREVDSSSLMSSAALA